MPDKFNMSIDDILSSLENENSKKETNSKAWSMAEIDELLGISASVEPVEEESQIEETITKEEKTPEEVDEIPVEETPTEQIEELVEPEDEKPAPIDEKTIRFVPLKKSEPKLEETPEEKPAVYDYEKDEEEPLEEATPAFDNSKSKIIMELADENQEAEDPEVLGAKKLEKKALAQKTVGIHPIRNENIEHQIKTEKIEKTPDGVDEGEHYRERFFNKPQQKLERTADYEKLHINDKLEPIERPGMIIKKSKFTNTADLEPVPTIISADAELNNFDKTIVANGNAKTIEHEDDVVDGQICLSGFGEEEAIEQIDEDHAEETLKEKRDKQVAEFKLETDFEELEPEFEEPEETEPETPAALKVAHDFVSDFIDDEYETPDDKGRILETLSKATKATGICGIAQAVFTVLALVITGIVTKAGGNLEIIGGSSIGCMAINIVILILASVCGLSTIIRGFKGLRSLKPNAASGTLIIVVACLLEDIIIAIFAQNYSEVSIYTAAACFALTASSIARYITLARALGNFEFITNGTQLYGTEKVNSEDDAFEIGRGLLIGEPEICYNSKVSTPSYFVENSFADDPADEHSGKLIYAVLAAAVVAAVVFGIVHKSFIVAFGMFTAVCCIAIPVFSLIASNISLFLVNRRFNNAGAMITGHKAIADSTDINAYALDSTDIFKKGTCSIIGIKTFHNMRIDDAILYAAALVIESGGPLEDIFDSVILGKKELLPPVESLAYEEKLGLSAWIHGRRVLLGSRDLLINHNVETTEKDFEMQYTHDGRKVMYLAIAGKIAAMFVIKYQADKHMRRYLQNVDKAGVTLLVRTCDCNITEEMICRYFNLPVSAVKILSPVSGDIFQKYRKEEIENSPAGILHNGTIEASLKTIYEARELHEAIPVNNIVSTIYTAMAVVLFILLTVLSGPQSITGGQVVLFQVLWTVIATAVPVLKRKFDK